jgi:hypothetical protein
LFLVFLRNLVQKPLYMFVHVHPVTSRQIMVPPNPCEFGSCVELTSAVLWTPRILSCSQAVAPIPLECLSASQGQQVCP